jgi:hypothetical protein
LIKDLFSRKFHRSFKSPPFRMRNQVFRTSFKPYRKWLHAYRTN